MITVVLFLIQAKPLKKQQLFFYMFFLDILPLDFDGSYAESVQIRVECIPLQVKHLTKCHYFLIFNNRM